MARRSTPLNGGSPHPGPVGVQLVTEVPDAIPLSRSAQTGPVG